MKANLNNSKSKKYLLLLMLVMVINAMLTVSLLRVSFGQTNEEDFSSQQPVKVEVKEQKDSPLRIVVVNVDNSASSFQDIVYSLQNVGNKSIRAYTLLADGKNSGKVITNSFATELFQVGKSKINNLPTERQNIKEGETILLSIDYAEFEDGSSWGNDSVEKSKSIAGEREGRKAAIKQLKDLIKNQNINSANNVANFLKQEIAEINFDVPDTNQSDDWKKGFRLGYKSVISILQRLPEQKTENLIKKLEEMEKITK